MQGTRWCVSCADSTQVIQAPVCSICGQRLEREEVCQHCRKRPPAWDQVRSWAFYGGALRHAIHRLKYKRDMGLADELARPLIRLLGELPWQIDLVSPVPLDLARMRERGYNQASLLAVPLAFAAGISYRPGAFRKVRQTPQQVKLSAEARRVNLEDAFQADRQQVAGKTVLVVDDVTTTGATLEACSTALKQAGAIRVFGLTLARAGQSVDHSYEDSWENQ